MVVKPVDGSGGKGLVVGPDATRAELDTLAGQLRADPRGWIAQPVVQLSTIPTLVDDGMRPRHADLRPFAVNDGNEVWVLPGGLTRVAMPEGQLVVNSSQGGGSKDTWVVGHEPLRTPYHDVPRFVEDQATVTEAITVIRAEDIERDLERRRERELTQDQVPTLAPRQEQPQQQQQQDDEERDDSETDNKPGVSRIRFSDLLDEGSASC